MTEEPVPFTDAELRAARMRLAIRRAAEAFRAFRKAWDRMDARIAETRADERRRRDERMHLAEMHVLRQERSKGGERASVVSRSDLRGPLMGDGSDKPPLQTMWRNTGGQETPGSWLPTSGGKHSGDCQCSGCVAPDADELRPIPISDDDTTG